MSSVYSTITSNVNLLLVNSSNITNFAPYIAYVSSVSIPGRIATVRDAVGLVSSPGRLIIVSTLKGVLFSDGTSSITISQPYGYVTLSSRDKNTWDIINTFAFPQPSPVSYVSSVYATASINANSIVARSYISTTNLTVDSISSINIRASTISTGVLLANRISTNSLFSFNSLLTNISSQTISTTNLFASLLSTNRLKTNDIGTSTVTFNSGLQNSVLSLSNDGQALLVNGIPTGTYKSVSTATTNLNMNNFSISNVNTLSSVYVTTSNITAINLQIDSISSINIKANTISTNLLKVNSISSFNINTNKLSTNSINTNSINVSSIAVYDAVTNTYLNPINASNGNLYINNQLNVTPYFTLTTGIINNGSLQTDYIQPNTLTNVNFTSGIATDIIDSYTVGGVIVMNKPITMYNAVTAISNAISNVLQTNYIADAATNRTLPTSQLVTNSNTSNIGLYTLTLITVSDTPFSFNTPFSKYRVSFYFTGNALGSLPGSNVFYCALSNTNTAAVYKGSNINDLYPLPVNQTWFNAGRTSFQYNDIFDMTGITDPVSVLLYGQTNSSNLYIYQSVNFYMTYEPLLS